jgi:predicted nucleic acid-binding protein
MIIDANVILRAFFPDEAQLQAPALLPYELSNAVWQAERRGRIPRIRADEILQAMAGLDIEILSQTWGVMLPLARQFDRSAYDAAYLTLAQDTGLPLLTGDLRLYHAVRDQLNWVKWIEDYSSG